MECQIFRILLKQVSNHLSVLSKVAWLYLKGGWHNWNFQKVIFQHFWWQNYYLSSILVHKGRKRFLPTTIFIRNTFFILFTMKIFFKNVSCKVLLLLVKKQLRHLPKHVLFLSYDINLSVEGHLFTVACVSLILNFPTFK